MDENEDQDGYRGTYPPRRPFADVANQVTNSVSYGNEWLDRTLRDYDPAYSNVRAGTTVIDPERKSRWGLRKSKKPIIQSPGPQIRYCGCKFCSNCQPQVSVDHMPCSHLVHPGHEKIRVASKFCCGPAQPTVLGPPDHINRPPVLGLPDDPQPQTQAAPFDPGWDSQTRPPPLYSSGYPYSAQSYEANKGFGNTYKPGSHNLPGSYGLSTIDSYPTSSWPPDTGGSYFIQPNQPQGLNADYYDSHPAHLTYPSQYMGMSSMGNFSSSTSQQGPQGLRQRAMQDYAEKGVISQAQGQWKEVEQKQNAKESSLKPEERKGKEENERVELETRKRSEKPGRAYMPIDAASEAGNRENKAMRSELDRTKSPFLTPSSSTTQKLKLVPEAAGAPTSSGDRATMSLHDKAASKTTSSDCDALLLSRTGDVTFGSDISTSDDDDSESNLQAGESVDVRDEQLIEDVHEAITWKEHMTHYHSSDHYTELAHNIATGDSGTGKRASSSQRSSDAKAYTATATSEYASSRLPIDKAFILKEASQPRDGTSNFEDLTDSIGKDELKAGLPLSLKGRLLGQLVERLVHDVAIPEEDSEMALLTVRSQMPVLLRQFAIILHAIANNDTQRSSATFIRHQRHRIANEFYSNVSDGSGAHDSISLMSKFALLWSQELELQPLLEARDFAFGGDPYLWLLSNMNRLAHDHVTSRNLAWETRDSLLNTIVISFDKATAIPELPSQTHAEVVLAWAPKTFLAAQCLDPNTPLGSVITICGDLDDAQATTCGQYVGERWPGIGPRVLSLLSSDGDRAVLDLDKSTRIEAIFEHDRTRILLCGDLLISLQAAETAVFMGTALRAAPFDHDASYCYPSFKGPVAGNEIDISYNITALPTLEESRSTRADCWLAMFRNPVIAHGYPIAARPGAQLGLEMDLSILQVLSQTAWLTEFDSLWVLKGFSSLVAPIAQIGSSLLWHFYVKKDGTRISYTAHEGTQLRGVLTQHSLMLARHFVGWHGNVHILAGTNKASYESIDLSASDPAMPAWCALAGVTITAGKYVTGGANFVRSQKDSPVYFESSLGPYYSRIDCATQWRVALFDTVDRIAWLVDGATAILHLCRAWMTWKEGSFESEVTANSLDHQDVSPTPLMADKILLNKHNRRLKIFQQSLDESDAEAEPGATMPHQSKKEASKWWRFEHLVIERWHILESIHDHLVRRRTSPPKDLDFDIWKTTLEGFNFVEVANAKSPIEPRAVHLDEHAGVWPMMCKTSDTISLFADNFGTLIASSETTNCRWNSAPLHSDYMVAPLNVLRKFCSECRHERDNAKSRKATGPGRGGQLLEITHGFFWSPSESPFISCDCKSDTGASGKACSKTLGSLRECAHPADVMSHHLAMAKLFEHSSAALVLGETHSRIRAGVEHRLEVVQKYAKTLYKSPLKGASDSGIDMGTSGSSVDNSLSPLSMSNTRSSASSDRPTEAVATDESISPLPQMNLMTSENPTHAVSGAQSEKSHNERLSTSQSSRSTRIPRLKKACKVSEAGSKGKQRQKVLQSSSKGKQRQEEPQSPDVVNSSSVPVPKLRQHFGFASSSRPPA